MNRTEKFKIAYIFMFIVLLVGIAIIKINFDYDLLVTFGAMLILLIPGRINGIFYRELFTARKLLNKGLYLESKQHSESFLCQLEARPHLKYLIWLSGVIYTSDPKAMTLNNLGAANLELGELDEAEIQLNEAISIDAEYPIPFFNLAIIHEIRKDHESAVILASKANKLGYYQGSVDKIVNKAQMLLSRIEGNET